MCYRIFNLIFVVVTAHRSDGVDAQGLPARGAPVTGWQPGGGQEQGG